MAPEAIVNFRDVGASINRITGTNLLKTKAFYRSARPDYATKADVELLKGTYGVTTILDLRTDTERLHQSTTTHDAKSQLSDSITTRIVDFNGRPYINALMKQLTYWQTAQLMFYYALGYRKEAIAIIGENVMAERGLSGLAEDSLQYCTAEVKAIFDILADGSPVLVHCTQGKDRTGLTVLLMLLLLHIPLSAITEDYMVSQTELQPEREQRLSEIRSIGLPESFADCAKDWPSHIASWIEQKYGSIEAYLGHCGVDAEQQQRVIATLKA